MPGFPWPYPVNDPELLYNVTMPPVAVRAAGALESAMAAGYASKSPSLRKRGKSSAEVRMQQIAKVEAKRCMQRLAEKKHLTTSIGLNPIGAAGTATNLVVMSQGNSATTRVGNQIHISELEFVLGLFTPAAAAAADIRVIVGWDHESAGGGVTITDVLESANWLSCYNKDKVKPGGRFQLLLDRFITLNNGSATVTTATAVLHRKWKLDKVVFYQSNAGTISDVLKNNLFVLQISANGTEVSAGNAQICYTDI